MSDLEVVVAAQQAAIAELRAELAQLRQERTQPPTRTEERPDPVVSRRALFGLAGAGIVGAAVGAGAEPASAASGDPLILGSEANSATDTTFLRAESPQSATLEIEAKGEGSYYGLGVTSDSGDAIRAVSFANGMAVWAHAWGAQGIGVAGDGGYMGTAGSSETGHGLGAQSKAAAAAWLVPETGPHLLLERWGDASTGLVGPPPGEHKQGMISLDTNGDLFLCTAAGDPGTWIRLNGAHGPTMLAVPQRAYDSRASQSPSTGPKGKFTAGETRTVDLTGATDLPADASAVLAVVTVTATSSIGYASLYAGDQELTTPPKFATISWSNTGLTTTNSATVAVAGGLIKAYASAPTHVIVDVVGYLE